VEAANRRLAAVSWKKLQFETASLQDVVARRRLVWSQLLADLERVMPREIRLVSIMPSVSREGNARVAISGVATSREAWLKLLAVLFTDRKFSDPMPSSEEAPSASNSQGYKFQLTFTYLAEGRS
jgi:Tfp pilus assembly protein PilN